MVTTGSGIDAVIEQLVVVNEHLGLLEHIAIMGISLVIIYIVLYVLWWVLSRLIYYI